MSVVTTVPVSVVIPCYRCAQTIRRAVESIVGQTVRPLEVILVDDDSGDDTARVLGQIQEELGKWVRIVRLPKNRGAAGARNFGWEVAKGEYVAFLDADDSWLPEKIERQFSFMETHPEFVLSGHLSTYGSPAQCSPDPHHRIVTKLWVLFTNPMVTPSFMVRRTAASRFDETRRHMEDHQFLQELVFSGAGVARLEETLARIHKAAFGEGGLSAELWAMERGELNNYASLRRAGRIGWLVYVLLIVLSLAKFCRRVVLTRLVQRPVPNDR
jgi:glycosyltransferase involved in cell wall biosynthesis